MTCKNCGKRPVSKNGSLFCKTCDPNGKRFAELQSAMSGIWWMSFADSDRPDGEQFLGVALVEASSLSEAMTRSWLTKCNPGGEVQSVEIPPLELLPPERQKALTLAPRDTLMDKAALKIHGLLD